MLFAQQIRRSLAHRVEVGHGAYVRARVSVKGTRLCAQIVVIPSPSSIVPRVEIRMGAFHPAHRNATGRKSVQTPAQAMGVGIGRNVYMRHLSPGVHACIGAARAGKARTCGQHRIERLLQSALHRIDLRLHLPAVKIGTVVFDTETQAGHKRTGVQYIQECYFADGALCNQRLYVPVDPSERWTSESIYVSRRPRSHISKIQTDAHLYHWIYGQRKKHGRTPARRTAELLIYRYRHVD